MNRDEILKILQYEGVELNSEQLINKAVVGSKIIELINEADLPPVEIIELLTSILGFMVNTYAKDTNAAFLIISIIIKNLIKLLQITPEQLSETEAKYKKLGLL